MLPKSADVVVVGGGIIGCATAFYLAKAGVTPLLLERGQPAGEASGESAGVLSPPGENDPNHPLFQLALQGAELYPSLAEELRATTGMEIEHRQIGILMPLHESDGRETLKAWAGRQGKNGVPVEILDRQDALAAEPLLSNKVQGAIRFSETGHVNTRTLVLALAAAARQHGATIATGSPVHAVIREGSHISGVRSGDDVVSTRTVVLAAGCWSGLFGESLGIRIPVSPVRGQLALVSPERDLPRHIIFSDDAYLVPTPQGEVILGTTVECVGFDKRSTVAGVQSILNATSEVVPSLGDATLIRAWAGLRPHAPDEVPLIGPHPAVNGLILATGHFRGGILFGPITGRLVQELILGVPTSIPLDIFRPDRQQHSSSEK